MGTPAATRNGFLEALPIGLLVLAFVAIAGSAMLHTSTTFDEIVFGAIGARGFHMGSFDLVLDHPKLPQYLFGFPAWLCSPAYPPEKLVTVTGGLPEYLYARAFFWDVGNNPERLALAMRLVGLAFGALVVASTYALSRRHLPAGAALFAAALVALLPDVLAHSGIAYTDVPLAFGFLVSVYALDRAVRDPTTGRVVAAALFCSFTVSLKYSGIVLAPVGAALLAAEALSGRWGERRWRRSLAFALPVFLAVTWISLALVGQGDWGLQEFIGRFQRSLHGTVGRDSFLWGTHYPGGRWYFFPIALALKTPAAFHVLVLLALVGAWGAVRHPDWKALLSHGARAPALGAAFFLTATMTTPLNIGTRHALPLLPLACILVAQGLVPVWKNGAAATRGAIALVFTAFALSGLRYYPYFLSYLNEYASGREMYETLVDSSTDWGQGLIGLRDFMRDRGIDSVALGYWGSAMPEGYGIRYATMPSYFALEHPAVAEDVPRYLAVSATVLAGTVSSDPYAGVRGVRPVAVVGGSIYIFDRGPVRPPKQ
jgi:Dolichyl-phosphate-mannose-protein mannosyltransferase